MNILSFDLRCLDLEIGKLHFTGGERQFFEVTKKWINFGHRVTIIGSRYTKYLADFFGSKVIVNIYEPLKPPPKSWADLINIRRMIRRISGEPFDFIYCPYELFEWVVASVLIKKKLKNPLVTSINLFEPHEISTFPFFILRYKTFLRNLFLKKSDLIFCASGDIKRSLIKLGINASRLFPIGSGINIDEIKAVAPQEKVFDACFMGDIIPRKGAVDLIYIWKNVVKKINNAKLIVIGKGWTWQYEQKIKTLVRRYDLQNNIIFYGFLGGEEKYRMIKRCKIFIFPSYVESFGQAVCEALACGLPVIAYNIPALREHYGDYISYVEKGDIRSMARCAVNILRNYDSQFVRIIEGMKRAEVYDWGNIARRMLDLIVQKLF